MKLIKLAVMLSLGSGLIIFLAPRFVDATDASAAAQSSGQVESVSYDAQVRAEVQSRSGPDSQVNICNASPERVLEGGHPGETGFYKAYDVNTANGRVAVYRDKNGIYWHFKGQGEAQNTSATVSGSGFIRWGSDASRATDDASRSASDPASRALSSLTQNAQRAPGAPEPSTAALYILGLLIGSSYLRLRRKQK